ncbi:sulfite exporter TauE/SafE family protein [Pseudooctadecabacter jejudonensis]|uniref:Probable membrane transporter protein n=1 Tax=Pseudooctadecabacter jejudonensis TaxID=1391910 RepID=A0A1Y5RZJ5_9RHOB|nr:sulfite exporter TauE/SafE family protein [Pseudooctadecabacter jejudonensis]SLN29233.1 Sulfite exporter TauE/SafE [Pseudooctadecabacter jejudonensis]
MTALIGLESILSLALVFAVALLAGFVKGCVGFAMPTVMMSGLTLLLPPEQALAALIIPTLLTNTWQALRQGVRSAWQTVIRFRVFLAAGCVCLVASAQLVPVLNARALFGLIGGPILLFACAQLAGWRPVLGSRSSRVEAAVGGFTGLIGGVSGIWGPPTVSYLTAINVPKQDSVRAQGTIYGLGAVALAGAHIQTGVLRPDTLPLSLFLIPAALIGLAIGFRVQDKFDQATFRRATLLVLIVAGLNLLRRAVFG